MKRLILFLSLISLVIIFYVTLPNSKAKVVVCDVGQGDAILATYKNIQMLFDVGPNNKKVLKCLENHLPFWDKTIEVVILTHGDSDHVGALMDLKKSYKVDNFFSNGYLNKDIEQKVYSRKIGQNDVISIGLFDFEVVSPPSISSINSGQASSGLKDGNENSVVGFLVNKNTGWSMFLSGDIDLETEQRLVWREVVNRSVEVLKVSHHGSKEGTSNELLEVLKPKTAVISVGKNNRFGHPTEEVFLRLKEKMIEIKRTDLEGEIIFEL